MKTPLAIVRACLTMLPRLEAEESQLAVQRTAVASGTMANDGARAVQAAWSRTVAGPVTVVRPTHDQLRGAGIGVRKVKRG